MDFDCHRYFSLNKKLFYKKIKRYGGIFRCSRKGYRKNRYLKWKKRVMKRSASIIIRRKSKKKNLKRTMTK